MRSTTSKVRAHCLVVCFGLALSLLAIGPVRAAGETGMLKAQDAATALTKGNAEQAIALYTEALQDQTLPNDRRAAIFNDRGVAHNRMGQPKLAVDDYNRAVQLFAEYAPVYNNRGIALLRLGLAQEAIRDFDRALVLAPGFAPAYTNRASALLKVGKPADAAKDFTRAVTLMPQSAAPLGGRGQALLAQGRPYAAIRDFSRALNNDARFAAGYRGRAEARLEIERFDEAIEDLSRAVAFEPENADLMTQRGTAYLLADNPAAAAKDFSRALELDPNATSALAKRALSEAKMEAFAEAEADLAHTLELDPRSVEAFAYRAFLYRQTGQPELGLGEIDKALKISTTSADVYWAKGEVEQALGRTDEAIASLKKAVALKPSHRDASQALQRLGALPDGATEISGAAIDQWRVFVQSSRYYAVLDGYPKLKVPLEMAGEGRPRLLEWELRKPPLKGIGVLRFFAGRVPGKSGLEDVEQVAVIDLSANQVATVQLDRQGESTSTWTWDEGKVTIASIDGVTDEVILRAVKPKDQVAQRRPETNPWGTGPSWVPWSQSFWGTPPSYAPRQQQARRQQKPKTIFDMLFGN